MKKPAVSINSIIGSERIAGARMRVTAFETHTHRARCGETTLTHDESDQATLVARDVMTVAPRDASIHSSVTEVVLLMKDADCGLVPLTEDGRPVGVVTDRDIALAIADHPNLAVEPIGAIMTKEVVSVGPDTTVQDVRAEMTEKGVRRVLVVDADGSLLGVVSWSDLAAVLSDRQIGSAVAEVVLEPPVADR